MSKFVLTDKAKAYYNGAIRFINDSITQDEGQTFALLRELNLQRNVIKEVKYSALVAREIFNTVSGLGAGWESITYPVYDASGEAEFITGSGDLPMANSNVNEIMEKVKPIGIAYSVSEIELERAMHTGRPLENRRLLAALRGMEEKVDKIAFFGDTEAGLNGLFTTPANLDVETMTADGTGSSKKWSTKTYDKVERDIMQMIEALPDPFQNEDLQLVVTPANKARLTTLRIGNTDKNLMMYLIENSNIKRIVASSKLKSVSTMSAKDVSVLMPMSSEVCELVIPRDRQIKAPKQIGRDLVTDVICDISGLHIYHPKAIIVTDES